MAARALTAGLTPRRVGRTGRLAASGRATLLALPAFPFGLLRIGALLDALIAQRGQHAAHVLDGTAQQRRHVGGQREARLGILVARLAQRVGQAFQHVEAHRARAARIKADHRIVGPGAGAVIGDRGQAGRRDPVNAGAARVDGLQQGVEPGRSRFDQFGHIDHVLADAHAGLAKAAALFLVQGAHFVGDERADHCATRLVQAPGDTAGRARQVVRLTGLTQFEQGGQHTLDVFAHLGLKTALGLCQGFLCAQIAADQLDGGFQRGRSGDQLGDDLAIPLDLAVILEGEFGHARLCQGAQAPVDFRPQGFHGGRFQGARFQLAALCIGLETQTVKPSDEVTLDGHLAIAGHTGQQVAVIAQALGQRAGAAVDKALHQFLVQGIGQPVLDFPGPAAPVVGVACPVRTVCGIGPGAHVRQAGGEGVDITGRLVQPLQLGIQPGVGQVPGRAGEVHEDGFHQSRMGVQRRPAEVRQTAGIPEPPDPGRRTGAVEDFAIDGQNAQCPFVDRLADALQHRMGRGPVERVLQGFQRALVEIGIAPLQAFDRSEMVGFHGLDDIGLEGAAFGGFAERAVGPEATGPAGDLANFGRGQASPAAAVELAALGEGDMVDIHVQTHADGIRGDQEIHFA